MVPDVRSECAKTKAMNYQNKINYETKFRKQTAKLHCAGGET